MAVTAAAIQAIIDDTSMMSPRVLKELPPYGGTLQHWYVSGGVTYPGRVKRVSTTASDDATTQATAVLAALLAGPA